MSSHAGPNFSSNLATGTAVVKAAPTIVYTVEAYNGNGSTVWVQLFNQKTALVGGEVPLWQAPVGTLQQGGFGADIFTKHGTAFSSGLVVGMSTTRGSYVAATASDHDLYIRYA